MTEKILLNSFNLITADLENLFAENQGLIPAWATAPTELTTKLSYLTSNFTESENKHSLINQYSGSFGLSGSYGFYSGSIQSEFSKLTDMRSSSYEALLTVKIVTKNFKISQDNGILPLLKTGLISQLKGITNCATAKAFVDQWGTHLITSVITGGLLNIQVSASNLTQIQKDSLSVKVSAEYNGIGTAKATATAAIAVEQEISQYHGTQKAEVVGGDAQGAISISDISGWIKSCNSSEIAIAFADQPVAFSDLIDGKASEILDEYVKYSMLATSLAKPRIWSMSKPLEPYVFVQENCTVNPAYKIIGGGGSVPQNSSSFLNVCAPQGTDTEITAWEVQSHDVETPANGNQQLEVYAISILDPFDLLSVNVVSQMSKKATGLNSASAEIKKGYALVGGGFSVHEINQQTKFGVSSYPESSTSWYASSKHFLSDVEGKVEVYAIGIQATGKYIKLDLIAENNKSQPISGNHLSTNTSANPLLCGGVHTVFDDLTGANQNNALQINTPSIDNKGNSEWITYTKDVNYVTQAKATGYAISLDTQISDVV